MDALWWIVLLVIAGVALVAALVDGTARLGAGGSGRAAAGGRGAGATTATTTTDPATGATVAAGTRPGQLRVVLRRTWMASSSPIAIQIAKVEDPP